MILYIFLLVLTLSTGTLLVRKILHRCNRQSLVLQLTLGSGLGLGLSSCLYFTLLAKFGNQAVMMTGAAIVISFAVLCFAFKRTIARQDNENTSTSLEVKDSYLTLAERSLTVLAFLASASFAARSWTHPHSDWDAIMTWNVRARFLERAPAQIFSAFSPLMTHADYPPMIPSIVAFGYSLTNENQLAAIAVAFIFTLAAPLLLLAVLSILKTRMHGLAAAALLFTTPFWTSSGAEQYADIPLSFYFLACLSAFALYEFKKDRGYLVLAGAFAALSAWTKNEGLLFMLCLIPASLLSRKTAVKKEILPLLAGALPVLAVLVFFKTTIAPANDIIAGNADTAGLFARLFDAGRFAMIAQYFVVYSVTFGDFVISPVPLLLLFCFLSRPSLEGNASKRIFYTVLFMLAGFFLVYQITPNPLQLHLITSVRRLFLQLWPLVILLVFSCIELPQERPGVKATEA